MMEEGCLNLEEANVMPVHNTYRYHTPMYGFQNEPGLYASVNRWRERTTLGSCWSTLSLDMNLPADGDTQCYIMHMGPTHHRLEGGTGGKLCLKAKDGRERAS